MKLYLPNNCLNMKKILLLTCIILISNISFAQKGSREKVKAFKVAYITEKLELSSTEAQEFWPLYNAHQETISKLRMQKRKIIRALKEANANQQDLSDEEATKYLDNHFKLEEQKHLSRKKLLTDLKKVISSKKILKLLKAETDFNKRILERIKEKRKRGN